MGEEKEEKYMSYHAAVNILDLIENVGEEEVRKALSAFSCPLNDEIENYIHKNAIEFSKRKISVTHLIMDEDGQIAGYFTLAHKPSRVMSELLSKSARKKLERYARLDETAGVYDVSAFLIAQIGKNAAVHSELTGNRMMEMIFEVLSNVQHQVGGCVVFLECEDKERLLEFYQNEANHFIVYGERNSEKDGILYKQLLRFF